MRYISIFLSITLAACPGLATAQQAKDNHVGTSQRHKLDAGKLVGGQSNHVSSKRSLVAGAQWQQVGSDIIGEDRLDLSGATVAISDDGLTIAVAAIDNDGNTTDVDNDQGHVRVYKYEGIDWVQKGSDIDGEFELDRFGHALAISGDGLSLAIGSPYHDLPETDVGRVRVFTFDPSSSEWVQRGNDFLGSKIDDMSGWSVALNYDGSVLGIGSVGGDVNSVDQGFARAYGWNGSTWVQLGGNIAEGLAGDRSGWSLSCSRSGQRIAVGGKFHDGLNGENSGLVTVYEFNTISQNWVKLGGETIVGYYPDAHAGHSVSLNGAGDIVAVGSPGLHEGKGSAEVWEYDGSVWNKKGTTVGDGDKYNDEFGYFVSISDDGNRIAVSAPYADFWNSTGVNERPDAGRVKVFDYNSNDGAWVQFGTNIDGDATADQFGYSIELSMNGKFLIVGAPFHSTNSTHQYAGAVRVFEISNSAEVLSDDLGTGGGDPHFQSFNGEFFSFHGQCDMVLMKRNTLESDELGLDVHIRTTRIDDPRFSYSYISGIAVQFGDNVIEAMTDGGLVVNGEDAKFSATKTLAGMTLKSSLKGKQKNIFVYDLILSDKNAIQIRANTKTGMLFIDCKGAFADSVGLLGSTAGMFGRDGVTNLVGHWNAWGEEWQVRDTEPKLFRDMKHEPQYPAGCLYEGASKRQTRLRRRLTDGMTPDGVSVAMANEACAEVISEELRNFCITDVLATGDIELAEDPFYV